METKGRASLAYKDLREIPREFLKSLEEIQVAELDLSHNELTYPFVVTSNISKIVLMTFICNMNKWGEPLLWVFEMRLI